MTDIRASAADDVHLLNPVEVGRRNELVHAADRARFTLGVSLSRRLSAERLGIPPADVVIDRRCARCGAPHGRPLLPGTGLHLSVSHAADLVVVALTSAGSVGVDIERVDETAVAAASAVMLGFDDSAPANATEFFTLWCRKESVVKATGDGMRVPLSCVTVSPPTEPPRLLEYPRGGLGAAAGAQLTDLTIAHGYVGALTVLCPDISGIDAAITRLR